MRHLCPPPQLLVLALAAACASARAEPRPDAGARAEPRAAVRADARVAPRADTSLRADASAEPRPDAGARAEPRADTGARADAGSATQRPEAAATADSPAGAGAAREAITHALVPAPARVRGEEPDMYHRFRIPLASARIAFVDLHYHTPLIEALGPHTLVINGGYWAYAGQRRIIQGLLVVNGERIAPFVPRAGGGVLSIRDGRAELSAAESWREDPGAQLALQCKPRLVSRGALVPKLEAQRRAARTALCIRDGGRTLDAYLTDEHLRPTLPELAAFLLAEGCEEALNLDGGPSTAAIFRRAEALPLAVGVGLELPYGLGFSAR